MLSQHLSNIDFSYFMDDRSFHTFGSWFLDNPINGIRKPFVINMKSLVPVLKEKNIEIIDHDDVWSALLLNAEKKVDHDRYSKCDIKYPPIVVRNENICSYVGQPFILLDGAHRMLKMKRETNITKSFFYVIEKDEFLSSISYDVDELQIINEEMLWYRNV